VNQSGGANGPTRGVYVGPTLTSAPNWASFHADHTSGIGFLQTGAAANRFSGKLKVGADADPLRNVDVAGTIRVSSSVDSAAMQRIWAGNTQGDMRFAKLGTNLSFAGDTLNATGGGGIPYDTTVTPSAKLVALNATQDTFTDLHGDIYDYESSLGAFYTLKNTRIQNDTLITHRGSFAQGYKTSRYSKTIAGNDNDTLNINANTALYDFEQSGGEFTHVIGPEEHYLLPGTSGTIKVFTVNVQVSLSSAVAAASNLGVYQNGNSTACFCGVYNARRR
jgi:hypothetical protein